MTSLCTPGQLFPVPVENNGSFNAEIVILSFVAVEIGVTANPAPPIPGSGQRGRWARLNDDVIAQS